MTREEAIGRIQEHRRIHSKKEPFTPYLDEAFDMAIEALKDRPHGEWEYWGSPFTDDTIANSIVCSLCKARYVEIEGEAFNFCPNCGADMRKEGEQNENCD